MNLLTFILSIALPSLGFSAVSEVDCDASQLQSKAALELTKHIKDVEKKMKSANQKHFSDQDCSEFIRAASREYERIAGLGETYHRNYLHAYLSEVTKDHPEVKAFERLAAFLQKNGRDKLLKKNAETKKEKFVLEKELVSGYRHLRKTIASNPSAYKDDQLPTTGHNCPDTYYVRAHPDKVLDELISTRPRPTIYHNVCSSHHRGSSPHPKEQKIITFDTSNGQALVFFCHQSFETSRDPRPKVQNYGDNIVTSKARCLAWDLVKKEAFLGDQKQSSIEGEWDAYVEVSDRRLELAKELGKTPMTYEEFLKKNPKLVAKAPEAFFEKVVPNQCKSSSMEYKQALHLAKIKHNKLKK